MRLASLNLENLFDRAKALNLATWPDGKPVLDRYARLNRLFNKAAYSAADKEKIRDGLDELGVLKKDDGGEFAILRQNKGKLLKRPPNKPVEVVAGGRGDWVGWLELKTEPIDEIATRNTAQVIRDLAADVLGVIEVEHRVAVRRFSEQLLPAVGAAPYEHIMVIDGNDERGIDVGIMTRGGFRIDSMVSHIDDEDGGDRIFSRDCPEYQILLPSGQRLLVLVNHFKSKGFGTQASSDARREAQAKRVREIYALRRAAGETFIAVIGDLNDTPDSTPLAPLLGQGSDLKDVAQHPQYQDDGRPGTFGNGTQSQKIDYILLSPALFQATQAAGVFRTGVWGGTHGTLWPVYPEMTQAVHAASDHAAIWVDLAL